MKIIGDGNISTIHMKHDGTDVNFKCIIKPPLEPFDFDTVVKPIGSSKIIFDDLMEVDAMINMLTRFKAECMDGIGEWRRVE